MSRQSEFELRVFREAIWPIRSVVCRTANLAQPKWEATWLLSQFSGCDAYCQSNLPEVKALWSPVASDKDGYFFSHVLKQ